MTEITYDVTGCEYEVVISKNTGREMLKQVFYDSDFNTVHTNFIFGDEGNRLIISMLKNPLDFLKIGREGRTPEALYLLLTESPEFFRTPATITLVDGDGKYKKIKSIYYADHRL